MLSDYGSPLALEPRPQGTYQLDTRTNNYYSEYHIFALRIDFLDDILLL